MRKTTFKKSLAIGLSVVMAMSMTACGGKGGNGGSGKSADSKENVKDMVYSGETFDISGVKGDMACYVVEGDRLYFTTSEWPEEENEDTPMTEEGASEETEDNAETSTEEASEEDSKGSEEETSEEKTEDASTEEEATEEGATEEAEEKPEEMEYANVQSTTRLYSMKTDGTDLKEYGEVKLEQNEYISYIMVSKDGQIRLFNSAWGSEDEGQTCYLATVDENANITDHKDITKDLGISNDTYVSRVLSDDKDNIYVITNDSVIILDKDMKKLAEIKGDNTYIETAAKTKDGDIACATSGEDGAIVQIVDVNAKKFGEKIKLEGMSYFQSSESLMNGTGDYDFFYKDSAAIYGYSIKDKKATKILDFLASEIDAQNTYAIIPIDKDVFVGQSWDEKGSVLTKYTKVDPSQVKDKETITFVSLWAVDDSIRNAAIKFNKENDKYRIAFKDYEGDEDALTKMNADIIAGNVGDIIDVSNMPVGQYVAKGILEDLTPFYEKDSDISKDDIIPSVEKAMEIEGKLYYVAPSFTIQTIVASKKDVGDESGWTFEDLKKLLEEKGDGVRPFYSENKLDTLYSFLYAGIDDYIDWTTGKCRFDSEDFKSVLEIANRGTDEEMDYSEDAPSQPQLIKSGKVLLCDGWFDTDSLQTYGKMYNTDINIIGYPCENKQGSYFAFDSRYAIYSKSSAKDGAWEFIRTLMTKDYQADGGHIWNNPTNKDAFEAYMKTKTTTEKYTDDYGNEIEPYQSSWGWDDMEIEIGPLSKEQEQVYRDLINNTTKVAESDEEVMNIINEEAKNYFNGQKSVDETADIIQNRVTTYVNENR
ncbi:MAG: hypothetical protein K6G76_04025 [Lachnospiraceae bacterium]|nr:hypothetical protein [Lachnospiraceae bacterium]